MPSLFYTSVRGDIFAVRIYVLRLPIRSRYTLVEQQVVNKEREKQARLIKINNPKRTNLRAVSLLHPRASIFSDKTDSVLPLLANGSIFKSSKKKKEKKQNELPILFIKFASPSLPAISNFVCSSALLYSITKVTLFYH